jgi:hypothetical protein
MTQDKLALVRQSLAAAESSIKTAKQLLSELESGGLRPSAKDLPGVVGTFDGTQMITEAGEKLVVPENYASKSMLVTGDTLKLVDEGDEKKFKQIEHVKRHKTQGILHKKEGKFKVITPEGSYNVLSASVDHFKGEVGDEVTLHLPAGNLTASYGAIETVQKKSAAPSEESEGSTSSEPAKAKASQPQPLPKLAPAKPKPVPPKEPPSFNKAKKLENVPFKPKVLEKKKAPTPAPVAAKPNLPPPGSDDELR